MVSSLFHFNKGETKSGEDFYKFTQKSVESKQRAKGERLSHTGWEVGQDYGGNSGCYIRFLGSKYARMYTVDP